MGWLNANSFFLIILLLCVGMHLFHGHGGHGDHGANSEEDPGDDGQKPDKHH